MMLYMVDRSRLPGGIRFNIIHAAAQQKRTGDTTRLRPNFGDEGLRGVPTFRSFEFANVAFTACLAAFRHDIVDSKQIIVLATDQQEKRRLTMSTIGFR